MHLCLPEEQLELIAISTKTSKEEVKEDYTEFLVG